MFVAPSQAPVPSRYLALPHPRIVLRVPPTTSEGITDLLSPAPPAPLGACLRISPVPALEHRVAPPVSSDHAPLLRASRLRSQPRLALVSCPALSQIKPHNPLLVV